MSGAVVFNLMLCFLVCAIEAPLPQKDPLKFCPYNGTSCCNSADDSRIQKQFQVMNISDSACAALVKSVLCAVRIQFNPSLSL